MILSLRCEPRSGYLNRYTVNFSVFLENDSTHFNYKMRVAGAKRINVVPEFH